MKKFEKIILFFLLLNSFSIYSDELLDADEAYMLHDYSTAFSLYEKLSEEGDVSAQFSLAMMYDAGLSVSQDYKQAFYWYKKAAEQGVAQAQYNIGIMYINGEYRDKDSIKENYEQAFNWYKSAAEQGLVEAQVNLGYMFKNGQGTLRDYKQALHWFKKSAEQGDVKAQINLGEMYKNGHGVARDYVEAHKWFNIALENGSELSITYINHISNNMTPSHIETAQKLASAWVEKHSNYNEEDKSSNGLSDYHEEM